MKNTIKLFGIIVLSALIVFPIAAGGTADTAGTGTGNAYADELNAQDVRELNIESIVRGNLGAGQQIWYSVRTAEAGILTVETTGRTDTYLRAYDAQRNLIAEDDDSGSGGNARIEILVTARTYYFFELSGFGGEASGAYRIMAVHDPMPSMTELRPGSFQNGNLAAGEERWFSVRAAQIGILIVETSGNTDTLLEARDENFSYITSDDDGGEDYNARIEIDVREGKTYYFKLWAYAYSDSGSGSYRIMADNTAYPAPVQLAPGSVLSGYIAPGESYWYSVRTNRSGVLVVETTGNLDTFLDAYTDSYELIASDDDGGEDLNARIALSVEAGQTYIFRLKGLHGEVSGPYRLFAVIE